MIGITHGKIFVVQCLLITVVKSEFNSVDVHTNIETEETELQEEFVFDTYYDSGNTFVEQQDERNSLDQFTFTTCATFSTLTWDRLPSTSKVSLEQAEDGSACSAKLPVRFIKHNRWTQRTLCLFKDNLEDKLKVRLMFILNTYAIEF